MFEILFTGSTAVLRLATLVKSAEVWVQMDGSEVLLMAPGKTWFLTNQRIQTYSSLFQIIFMEDKEE